MKKLTALDWVELFSIVVLVALMYAIITLGLVNFWMMVFTMAFLLHYLRLFEELIAEIPAGTLSTKGTSKTVHYLLLWWTAWKAGSQDKFLRKAYFVLAVIIVALQLLIEDRLLAVLLSAGPIATIIVVAIVTQPLIVGKRILGKKQST